MKVYYVWEQEILVTNIAKIFSFYSCKVITFAINNVTFMIFIQNENLFLF